MALNWFKNFGKTKAKDTVEGAARVLASWDPEGAGEADIRTLEDKVTELAKKRASAQTHLEREQRETAEAEESFTKYRSAAVRLKNQMEGVDEAQKALLLEKISKIVSELEPLQQEIERERQEDLEAQQYFAQVDEIYQAYVKKLKDARGQLEKGKQAMKAAKMQAELAKMKERQQKELAGLSKGLDGVTLALDAMQLEAEKQKEAASASKAIADSLSSSSKGLDDDPVIAQALAGGTLDNDDPLAKLNDLKI